MNNITVFEFDTLPSDLQVKVLGFFTPRTLKLMEQTSHSINKLIHEHAVWRDSFDRESDELKELGISLQDNREITQITDYKKKCKWLARNKIELVIATTIDKILTVLDCNLYYNIDKNEDSKIFDTNDEGNRHFFHERIKWELCELFVFAKHCDDDSAKRSTIVRFAKKQNPLLNAKYSKQNENNQKLARIYNIYFDFVIKETSA